MYKGRAPRFLNKIIAGREKFDLNHYIGHAKRKLRQLSFFASFLLISFLVIVNLIGLNWTLSVLGGFIFVFVILNLPNIKESFGHYYAYLKDTQILNKHHFKLYVDFLPKEELRSVENIAGPVLNGFPEFFLEWLLFTRSSLS